MHKLPYHPVTGHKNSNITKLTAMRNRWIVITAIISLLCGCCGDPLSLSEAGKSYAGAIEMKAAVLEKISSIITSDTELTIDIKNKIKEKLLQPLDNESNVIVIGMDVDVRPVLVNFQKAFEQISVMLLTNKEIKKVTAVIHTSKPSTPLLSPENSIDNSTLHPEIIDDQNRLQTIKERVVTLRDMAMYGDGMKLYIAYEKKWAEDVSFADKYGIYQSKVKSATNKSLIDSPLACELVPARLIGASYLIELQSKEKLLLSLTGIQAIEGSGEAEWKLWFDTIAKVNTLKRLEDVYSFLKDNNQDIKELKLALDEVVFTEL